MGRLTADPELKQTQNRISVRHPGDRSPGTRDKTDFINFVAWRDGRSSSQVFSEGAEYRRDRVLAGGMRRIQRTAFEVVVDRAEFVERRQRGRAAPGESGGIEYLNLQGFEEIPPEEICRFRRWF